MQSEKIQKKVVDIKVVGIGGGGNSVIKRIADEGQTQIDLIAINTDKKQLQSLAGSKIELLQLDEDLTRGLGSGGRVSVGQEAAINEETAIKDAFAGADMIFITAGMGGGTGTGAVPVIAEYAQSMGILTIGVVTMPFSFEGSRKMKTALKGIEAMRPYLDAMIVINNDKLMALQDMNKHLTLLNAFEMADGVLKRAIRCVTELILSVGIINVDFADICSIFRQNSNAEALLGIGEGEDAVAAVKEAIKSPLIERKVEGARGIILNITGDKTLSLFEVNAATKFIYESTSPDVNIILGTMLDESLNGKVRATIIATDFEDDKAEEGNKEVTTQEEQKNTDVAEKKESSFDLPTFMQKRKSTQTLKTIFDVEKDK